MTLAEQAQQAGDLLLKFAKSEELSSIVDDRKIAFSKREAVDSAQMACLKGSAFLLQCAAALREREGAQQAEQVPGLEWALEGWRSEVKDRPMVNVHRRHLDFVWRKMIKRFGGDPDALVGPDHDALRGLPPLPLHKASPGPDMWDEGGCKLGNAAAPEAPAQPEQGEREAGDVVAFELYNPKTGHAIVDYSRQTHVGHLTAEAGYEARPLVYAAPRQTVLDGSKPIPAWQAREALDELEAAARGDAPFNHQAAAVIRAALEARAASVQAKKPMTDRMREVREFIRADGEIARNGGITGKSNDQS